MIMDQNNDNPTNYVSAGANYTTVYSPNAASFFLLDLYVEIVRFTLSLCKTIRFNLEK